MHLPPPRHISTPLQVDVKRDSLSKRWRSLSMGRKLAQKKICVAIARELSGFIWDVAPHVKVSP